MISTITAGGNSPSALVVRLCDALRLDDGTILAEGLGILAFGTADYRQSVSLAFKKSEWPALVTQLRAAADRLEHAESPERAGAA